VQQAINVQKADPELLKKVGKGTVGTLREAAKIVEKPKPPVEQYRPPMRDQRLRMLKDAIRKLNACVKHSPNDPVGARIRAASAEVSAIRKSERRTTTKPNARRLDPRDNARWPTDDALGPQDSRQRVWHRG
jgi:hypothetical protein